MSIVSIRQAADMVGVTRQALYRMVASGKVSATVAPDGTKVVDTAELLRHFGRLQSPDEVTAKKPDGQRQSTVDSGLHATVNLQIENERLKGQLAAKDVEIAMLRQRVEDLRDDKTAFIAFVERQQRLLEAPKKKRKAKDNG